MSFTFGSPPPAGQPPAQPAAPAAPNPFGGPPPPQGTFPTQPLNVDAALYGFGDADIDLREPWLPMGSALKVRIDEVKGKAAGRHVGAAVYIRVTCTGISNAGGGNQPAPLPKNANMLPATVGGKYTIRIDGFDKPDAAKFARSDLKLFLIAALEKNGLTAEVAATLPPAEWEKMGRAAFTGALTPAIGQEVIVTTGKVDTKGGFTKQKTTFYPLSAAG
jgi:hypothetical protein